MAGDDAKRLGRYEIVAKLGAGGMGEVLRARDPRVDREVAIKVLPAELAGDPERRARFEKEARAAGALNHPNLMAVYDVGDHDGAPFLVTELLEGETLRERLGRGPLERAEVIDIARQIARGLAAVHGRDVVHRDIKPSNLFVCDDGAVKILDFGIARQRAGAGVPETRTGAVLGTPRYMSPEQVRGRSVDHRTDIFSLGVVLYEMASGRRPFEGDTDLEIGAAILETDPEPLDDPHLDAVVRACLAKDPGARPASAEAVIAALDGAPRSMVRPGLWAITAGLAAAAVVTSVAWPGDRFPLLGAAVARPPAALTTRAITTIVPPQELQWRAISRDGRRLAYVVDRKGPIVVQEIDRGEPRTVPPPEGADIAAPLDFFPDGRLLVGMLIGGEARLAIYDLDTRAVVRLEARPDPSGQVAAPVVSPDGDRVLYIGTDGVRVLDVDSGDERLVIALPDNEIVHSMSWSPGGDHLALLRYRGAVGHDRHALEIVSLDGRRTERLDDAATPKQDVDWSAPDRLLYSTADSVTGQSAIWSVAVVGGRLVGEPELLRRFDHVVGWIKKRGDRLYYARRERDRGSYVVSYRRGGQPLTRVADGRPVGWTGDDRIALVTGDLLELELDGEPTVLAGGPDRELATASMIRPDSLVFWRRDRAACHLMRDPDRRGPRPATEIYAAKIVDDRTAECPALRCAADRPDVCVIQAAEAGELVFRRFDLETGRPNEPFHHRAGDDNRAYAVSADGRRLSYARERFDDPAVVAVDIATGAATAHGLKDAFDGAFLLHDVGELPGGRGWLVTGQLPDHDPDMVLAEVLADSTSRIIATHRSLMHDPRLSPDGTRVLVGIAEQHRNIWVLEGIR